MHIASQQQFELTHPQGHAAALAFVRDAGQSLGQVHFLRDLRATDTQVSGELVVAVPLIGTVDLPFVSDILPTEQGAVLRPHTLDERAWVAVSGKARVVEAHMHFEFDFVGHLATPSGEHWGSAAFEKMVQAAAQRTLERVAAELPAAVAAALPNK